MLCSALWDLNGTTVTISVAMNGTRDEAWETFPATVALWESAYNLSRNDRVSMTVTPV